MLFIITKETTLPREKVRQIIMTGVVGMMGCDDGVGKMDIAPIFQREGGTGGGDTVEQVSLRGIVGDLVDRIGFKIWKLQDGVGVVDGPIGPGGRNCSPMGLGRGEGFIGRVRVLSGRHCGGGRSEFLDVLLDPRTVLIASLLSSSAIPKSNDSAQPFRRYDRNNPPSFS